VAGISLVIGGIGIMNIMLVSVTERTREIGVRLAMGARKGDIQRQFLVEAGALGGLGGVLGIAAGVGVAHLVSAVVPGFPAPFVPLWSIGLAFGFSVGVGLVFGLYPAARAARLDPIEALRYE
jgi:putative ABC transport system permease protein